MISPSTRMVFCDCYHKGSVKKMGVSDPKAKWYVEYSRGHINRIWNQNILYSCSFLFTVNWEAEPPGLWYSMYMSAIITGQISFYSFHLKNINISFKFEYVHLKWNKWFVFFTCFISSIRSIHLQLPSFCFPQIRVKILVDEFVWHAPQLSSEKH